MYQIQLWNDLSDKGLKRFTDDYHVQRETEQPDAFLVRSKDLHDMRFPDSLKAVARAGVGVNTIPLDQLANRGIPVFSTPGANANAVKELVIGSLFLTARKLVPSLLWTNNLRGPDIPERIEANKKQFVGTELLGKRIGIVGLGAIGANLANTLHELGMTVTGYDPHMSVESAWRVSNQIQRATQLEDLLATSDYITLHLPLVDATTGLLDASLFSKMKHGATLLNFSRGELVDEQALAEVLRSGRLANYVTDFPNAFILSLPRVIALPHIGASTSEAEENCAIMAVDQLRLFLETGNIRNAVNFPAVELPFTGKRRITIAHHNIPNMVGQIASVLAQESINIANMINGSKDAIAYTIIDIDNHADEMISLDRLNQIPGVLKTRLL
ncbi:3-phosphoglycerate dehydrogenase [Exiguobacterium indicum]|uniref:D-3-phosphoglycerate dehydrogenase n=1 Tax=Exiguobacterium indicum TaxID=296995 RepID=A0A0V8GKL6_9BACL|nr:MULTISPECIES: phosphoglycerate dehydrogenase [Exiguobacterium]KSU50818.1 3-phosphoglycerate dehydrogenase [Exiguobacterium enclense]KTR26166.1 3-phosphoglycerate dehydrogenase [Exiguobacterium indicum]MCQ4090075.1 phosphoglycerate dehydrogenase [Exiguobacterium sp. LL15]NTY09739.1 3-phosphoglycerate dehydrogenase [Exiguobacterium sp. JMULE1]SDC09993.1 D-3-phosphoglycerate dehydrogenase [Exiguobacterium enclense]